MILALIFLVINYGTLAESLMCFQCVATSSAEPCNVDWESLANLTTRQKYAKDCSAVKTRNWTRCAILSVAAGGKYSYYERDCHDGVSFSKDLQSPSFIDLPPDNQTECDNAGDKAICYTSCDTDFCNGPQPILETIKNCTDMDYDEDSVCAAPRFFGRTDVIVTEVLGLMMSLFVIFCVASKYH